MFVLDKRDFEEIVSYIQELLKINSIKGNKKQIAKNYIHDNIMVIFVNLVAIAIALITKEVPVMVIIVVINTAFIYKQINEIKKAIIEFEVLKENISYIKNEDELRDRTNQLNLYKKMDEYKKAINYTERIRLTELLIKVEKYINQTDKYKYTLNKRIEDIQRHKGYCSVGYTDENGNYAVQTYEAINIFVETGEEYIEFTNDTITIYFNESLYPYKEEYIYTCAS